MYHTYCNLCNMPRPKLMKKNSNRRIDVCWASYPSPLLLSKDTVNNLLRFSKMATNLTLIVLTGPPVMVDVEFKIISIGEIKEAEMVRDNFNLVCSTLSYFSRISPSQLLSFLYSVFDCSFIAPFT